MNPHVSTWQKKKSNFDRFFCQVVYLSIKIIFLVPILNMKTLTITKNNKNKIRTERSKPYTKQINKKIKLSKWNKISQC